MHSPYAYGYPYYASPYDDFYGAPYGYGGYGPGPYAYYPEPYYYGGPRNEIVDNCCLWCLATMLCCCCWQNFARC
ncbi:unnamed protein product [Cylicocyclus nassatus]|uniref:Uncharacterized protein n=1 Tax=Cylicocyclus nassatus TaxID=53992 RepID=A0AA36GYH4_CYLNA|nr:unnamed protein product [Cylicocyclus nassatus]CAJ0600632.1 unnamed protein product [Cylicocyclus nassatus]